MYSGNKEDDENYKAALRRNTDHKGMTDILALTETIMRDLDSLKALTKTQPMNDLTIKTYCTAQNMHDALSVILTGINSYVTAMDFDRAN